jgi:hypothetical protein
MQCHMPCMDMQLCAAAQCCCWCWYYNCYCCCCLQEDLAPIQRLLTDELMTIIFSHLGPYTLGQAACVCRQWRYLTDVSGRMSEQLQCSGGSSSRSRGSMSLYVPQAPLATKSMRDMCEQHYTVVACAEKLHRRC